MSELLNLIKRYGEIHFHQILQAYPATSPGIMKKKLHKLEERGKIVIDGAMVKYVKKEKK